MSRLALAMAVVLVAAKVGGDLAVRAKQPSVLGELLAGILLGSLPLAFFRELRTDASFDMLARVGVLVMLFEWSSRSCRAPSRTVARAPSRRGGSRSSSARPPASSWSSSRSA